MTPTTCFRAHESAYRGETGHSVAAEPAAKLQLKNWELSSKPQK
jgi:hypothetical protein